MLAELTLAVISWPSARARADHRKRPERVLHGGCSTLGRCSDNGEGTVASHSRNTLHTNPLIASKRLTRAAAFRIQKRTSEPSSACGDRYAHRPLAENYTGELQK